MNTFHRSDIARSSRPASLLFAGLATLAATTALTFATMPPSTAQSQTLDAANLWIPVARINPEIPLSIVILNDTSVPLEYGFSTNNIAPQELAVGDEVTLTSAPIPTGLFINAFTSAAVLDYAIETIPSDNTLSITVSLVDQLYDASGFSAIDIHETGAIYRY